VERCVTTAVFVQLVNGSGTTNTTTRICGAVKDAVGILPKPAIRFDAVVTAEDVAETMLSLVEGNRFVTGEIIVIDGGFTAST